MWPFKRRKNEVKARDEPLKVNRNRNLRMINRPRADNTIQGNEAISPRCPGSRTPWA